MSGFLIHWLTMADAELEVGVVPTLVGVATDTEPAGALVSCGT